MKIAFAGFRHGHIDSLYRQAGEIGLEIVKCVEEVESDRVNASERLSANILLDAYESAADTDADIVAVGCAYGDRGRVVIDALKKGKHVLSDKPLCTSLDELNEIERLCKEKNLKVGLMLDLRYIPAVVTAKNILADGRLGEIKNVSFTGQHCLSYGKRPSWYFEKGMHGGTINDIAIHGIDLLYHLAGLSVTQVDGVRTWNSYADREPDFKDSAVFMARLNDGIQLLADVSYCGPSQVFSMPTYWNFKFWCKKGMLTFCVCENDVTVYEEGKPVCYKVEGTYIPDNCITDLVGDINNDKTAFTDSVLRSTRSALELQKKAEQ